MINNVQLFNFEGQDVRVVWIENKKDWWYNLADVCKLLGIANASQAAQRLKKEGICLAYTPTSSGDQEMLCIDEPNYFRLIFRSDKPNAVAIQDWTYEEVLPAIRKTGYYSMHGINFDNLVELDPCKVKDDKKLIRRIIIFYEDVILGAQKKRDLYKGLEDHYYPEQARPRGRRDVSPINVYATDDEVTHLVFGIFEKEIVVQTTFVFEE